MYVREGRLDARQTLVSLELDLAREMASWFERRCLEGN